MQDTKKVAGELLVELEKKGVTFETVDGKLKYKDSKGNFTENSKEKVKKSVSYTHLTLPTTPYV